LPTDGLPTTVYDLVVVGIGPAGARTARRFAAAGHDVLALERGEVGRPLACSGHVSTDLWAFLDDARDALLQNEVRGARFHVDGPESGAEGERFYRDEPISNVIDRVALDRRLADLARDAGADVREDHTVTGVEERADRVVMTVSTPTGERAIESRLVAGCDGPTSRVRRSLGLPEPDELLHGVLGFADAPDDGDFVDVHLTPPRFFAWRIPRGEAGVEYGLAAPPGADVSARFEALVDAYGADVTRRCSGTIPVGPPTRTTSERGFLVGDAAAMTKPFTGGGILYGMTAADAAAATVDPRDPATLADYEAAWRAELGREIRLGHWLRRAYSLPEPLQRAGLRALSGEVGVHMDRPSTFFSRAHLRRLLR
jgi:electron-transferring-flavoprotein dehydrogenase